MSSNTEHLSLILLCRKQEFPPCEGELKSHNLPRHVQRLPLQLVANPAAHIHTCVAQQKHCYDMPFPTSFETKRSKNAVNNFAMAVCPSVCIRSVTNKMVFMKSDIGKFS
jgi:hypothetical protein